MTAILWRSVRTGIILFTALALTSCEASRPSGKATPWRTNAPRVGQYPPPPTEPVEIAPPSRPAKVPPIIRPGTGVFAQGSGPMALTASTGVTESGEEISVNFVDADIREVVKSIIGIALKAPFIIDPKVQGQISLQSSRPVSRNDALLLLENALKINGAALVENGGTYSVMPLQEAPRGLGRPHLSVSEYDRAQGFGVHIIPLHNISAPEMAKILQPFIAPDRVLKAEASRQVLVVAGTRQEIKTIQELVNTFDVDWLKGMSFGMFTLQTVKPSEMAKDLSNMFGSGEEGPLGGLIRFVPVDRLNALLVIAQRPHYLRQIQTWIEDLDSTGTSDAPRLYVYYVQNGNAENLAATLSEIFTPGGKGGGDGRGGMEVAPGSMPMELRSSPGQGGWRSSPGFGSTSPGMQSTPRSGYQPMSLDWPRRPVDPAFRQVADTAALPNALPDPQPPNNFTAVDSAGIGISASPSVRVIADRDKNAIVIMASPRDYQMVQDALRRLDIAPLQVLIEATIAEVTLNDDLEYGIEWFFKSGNHTLNLVDQALAPRVPGFSYLFSSGANQRVVLNALASVTDVNVISSPHLLVIDNQQARLQVGDQVPVATQSAVSVLNPDSPIVNSISYRDTGVILEVRPRVGAGGNVLLDINQEVSDVVPTVTSGIESPTIQQRNIHSTVSVMDGQAVALGGLIKDAKRNSRSGVPILKDIPVLGLLFSNTTNKDGRTELLIMLTPHVIRNHQDAQQATDELQLRMRAIDPLNSRVR